MNNTVTKNSINVDFNICLRPFLSAFWMEDFAECPRLFEIIVTVDPFRSSESNFEWMSLDKVAVEFFL